MLEYPNKLNLIFDKLKIYNIKPVIVGGYVRDYFLNFSDKNTKYDTKDIDIELYNVDSFEKVQTILSEFGNPNLIGKSFGVIKLKVDDLDIDFSLPRIENKVSSGHCGFEVETYKELSFYEASSRRDFTINAIGYDLSNKEILDPHHGLDDLKAKKLKIVNKKTFLQDPLRVLRAMQFCARFNLNADSELLDIASHMCNNKLLDELPRERIYEEFKKLFIKSTTPSIGLDFLKKVDGLIYFNELNMQSKDWQLVLSYVDNVDKTKLDNTTNITIMLALICYKMDNSTKNSFLNKITNKNTILKNIDYLKHIDNFLNKKISALNYNIAKKIDIEMLTIYLDSQNISSQTIKKIRKIRPLVNGKELLDIGMKKSKDFGLILQLIYEMQINKLFSQVFASD